MELVKQNKGYKKDLKRKELTLIISDELRKHPNLSTDDMAIINYVCNLIEELVKKKYGIDKFQLLVDIFKTVLNKDITNLDKLKISVQFLIDNRLIKNVKVKQKVYSYVKNIIISNFLFRDK